MNVQDFVREIKRLEIAQQYEEALQVANQAVEMFPSEGVLFVSKGGALVSLNRKVEALESYERAFQLGVQEWRVYSDYAFIKQQLGDVASAFEYYQKAIDVGGGDSGRSGYLVRGHLYRTQGDWKNAILDYYRYLLSGKNLGRRGIASCFFNLMPEKALHEFEGILANYPNLPEGLVIRAVLKDAAKDLVGAINDLKEAIKALPYDKKLEKHLSGL